MTDTSQTPDCRDVQRAIQEALGATGLPAEVARHIETCPVCGREAGSIARLVGGFRSLPVVEPPQAFWDDLPSRALAEVRSTRRRHSWALSALAAAALLLFTVIPADRVRWSVRSFEAWSPGLAATESWLDPFEGVRSAEEAALLVHSVAVASDLGPQVIQRLIQVTEEEAVGRPNVVVWNLLDTLGPHELVRVLARVEKGERQ